MITLITGGSKCGKSRFAEKLLDSFTGSKVYIATMQPIGDEAFEAIGRHRRLRQGKGFATVEKYTDISEVTLPEGSAVLIECVGNLCANEMFSGEEMCYPADKIAEGIRKLSKAAAELVIVTNQVGSDGIAYAETTAAYIAEMGEINRRLAAFADNVVECVYGIPIAQKGELPC